MSKIGVFMATGCEEIEGLTVVDIARRAGIEVTMISVGPEKKIVGSHDITFMTDETKDSADYSKLDGIVLPGGMPGTIHLGEDETVNRIIREFATEGKLVSAICAAPSVLGQVGLLQGKNATCYPGFEEKLIGATCLEEQVVRDGNIITARGMGTAIPFALEIVRYFLDDASASRVADGLVYKY